jgi:hypothetical protein
MGRASEGGEWVDCVCVDWKDASRNRINGTNRTLATNVS